MRTFRRTRLLAATGAALTALALTACANGTGTRDEGASTLVEQTPESGTTAPTTTGKDQSAPSGQGGSTPKTNPNPTPEADPADGSETDPADDWTLCNGTNTRTTVQEVPRPLNHMLMTVTNTGSQPCALMYYPVIRFDEMQWVPQAIEDSKPQSVPMLEPGESGYAGIRLSAADGSGTGGSTGRTLTVRFQGSTPDSDGGPAATPTLPAGGVYYDSELSVTYWQSEPETALN
ncbi:DUF4232 domain-containing protein [Streptomyces sp. NPDC004610]|uniref:DUF4232 domain-containing protein n=1 Tax=unclassified Streptomyces TaxID=2593676 RepID=UPI0033A43BAA